jgi:Heparinase II/III-like protein
MRKLLFFVAFWGFVNVAFAQLQYLQNVKSVPNHPRIMLLRGEEKEIQQSVKNDLYLGKIHQSILQQCDKMLSAEPLKRIQIGRRLLDKSREALRRIFYLSYAYRTTNDRKYLQRAETELLTVAQFSDWNPSHFLDVGEMTMAVAIGYDWLYDSLQPSTLPILREAILSKGIAPSFDARYNSWLTASHNWNQVCNAGMTYGALAIFEDNPDLAKRVIDRAIGSIKLPMEDYAPHGAYPEGYSYWGYGTSFNVLFLSAIERALGSEYGLADAKGFLQTASYYQHMVGSSGQPFNYSDAGSSGAGVSPAVFWFAKRNKDNSLLFNIKNVISGNKTSANDRILPAALVWGSGISFEKVIPPQQLLWSGQGKSPVTMLRTSWTNPNAIYVGLKAGSASVNHAHMDVGSFVMDALGQRWAMDFGMQEYESLESKGVKLWGREQSAQRWEVFRYNNFVHNTLTINGQLHQVEGYADIERNTTSAAFLSSITNLSNIYSKDATSVKRGVAIVESKAVLVQDEIVANQKTALLRWTMATPATVQLLPDGTAELTQNGKKLTLKVLWPANAKLQTWPTTPLHDYDAPNPNTVLVGFETTVPAAQTQKLQVLLLPDGAPSPAKLPALLKDWK